MYVVFETQDLADTVVLLNVLLAEYAHPPRLSAHGTTPWHLHVDSSDHEPWADWFAASSALALASLLAEKQRNPGGLCASPTCGRPFIDLGKGGGRKYCSPRCATRTSQRSQEQESIITGIEFCELMVFCRTNHPKNVSWNVPLTDATAGVGDAYPLGDTLCYIVH